MTKTLLSILLISTSLMTKAATPDAKTSNEQFNDWVLTCVESKAAKNCHATQQVSNQQGQLVSTLNILKAENGNNVIEIVLPLMLDLTIPVAVQIDDEEVQQYPYRLCNSQACFVLISGETPLMQKMKKGLGMRVQAKPATQSDYLQVQFSLKGFSRAVQALNKALD